MNREYLKWHSAALNREMELLVFGHAGSSLVELVGILFGLEGKGQDLAVGQVGPEGDIGQVGGDA